MQKRKSFLLTFVKVSEKKIFQCSNKPLIRNYYKLGVNLLTTYATFYEVRHPNGFGGDTVNLITIEQVSAHFVPALAGPAHLSLLHHLG